MELYKEFAKLIVEVGVTVAVIAMYIYKDLKFGSEIVALNKNIVDTNKASLANQEELKKSLQFLYERQNKMAEDTAVIKSHIIGQ